MGWIWEEKESDSRRHLVFNLSHQVIRGSSIAVRQLGGSARKNWKETGVDTETSKKGASTQRGIPPKCPPERVVFPLLSSLPCVQLPADLRRQDSERSIHSDTLTHWEKKVKGEH
jgi:hypothetical protein